MGVAGGCVLPGRMPDVFSRVSLILLAASLDLVLDSACNRINM